MFRRFLAIGLVGISSGCDGPALTANSERVQQRIIDGDPAPGRSAVVRISQRDTDDTCSGAVIAPSVVLTAKHCVFTATSTPLTADAVRVGFGSSVEQLEVRAVDAIDWIGAPGSLSVPESIARGEDVAILKLAEPAPSDVEPLPVHLAYVPKASDTVVLVGFGLSSLETGANGTRLESTGAPTGFDRDSGVVQIEGPSACFGDSGGPVLLSPSEEVVGVIGQIGGTSDASFCDIDLTFMATTARASVAAFIAEACERAGGCGPRGGVLNAEASVPEPVDAPPGDAADARGRLHGEASAREQLDARAHDAADARTRLDSSPDGSSAALPRRQDGCGCAVGLREQRPGLAVPILIVLLGFCRRPRRPGRSTNRSGFPPPALFCRARDEASVQRHQAEPQRSGLLRWRHGGRTTLPCW
jgi:V8-like Glu-specific endopeptidase